MDHLTGTFDTVVVGGGLAGLTAAALLARGGQRVVLFERAHDVGGRAVTFVDRGFHLNLGPHAWYVGGPGTRVLQDLGVSLPGGRPRPTGLFALAHGAVHTLPGGLVSLLTTDLLSLRGKLEAARWFTALARADAAAHDAVTLRDWLDDHLSDDGARALLETFFRVSSYADAPRLLSAGSAIASLQLVLGDNVRYLDHGWGPVVQALDAAACRHGVKVVRDAPVREVLHGGSVEGVRLAGGAVVRAGRVIVTGGPSVALDLLPHIPADTTRAWSTVPSRAACLDSALARLPRPDTLVVFGIDEPLYYSVHSAAAALAPPGGAVVHAARYLDPMSTHDAAGNERELERLMDRLQPGWRADVVVRRYLPSMVVTHAIPEASRGGLRGRPPVQVPGVEGLYLAGDWVGDEGMLANAAVASGARAGRLAAGVTARHGAAARPEATDSAPAALA